MSCSSVEINRYFGGTCASIFVVDYKAKQEANIKQAAT
jgi:hypothetical protein